MLLAVTAKWFQLAVTCHKELTTGFIDCQHQFMMQGVLELVDDEIQLGNLYKEHVNKILWSLDAIK